MTDEQGNQPPPPSPLRWQFKLLEIRKYDQVEETLNYWGAQGWDCVNLAQGQVGVKVVMKRAYR